jgi:enoyl-CoA hydratase/carnithine racemase
MTEQESTEYLEVLYEVSEQVATVTLHRPERLNAWTDRMASEVKHAIARAEADRDVAVILLTGSGRGFCAGADLKTLSSISEGKVRGEVLEGLEADPGDAEMEAGYRATYTYLMSVRKPVIAVINGACAGMAVPIALACDLRFASDKAVFTTAFSQRGLVAEWGIGWLLPRLVGPANALDLLFSARKVDAAEAAHMGLVNRVLPADELLDYATDYARNLARNCSPISMQTMKRQVYESLDESLGDAHSKSVQLMFESFKRPDFKEGVKSFLEKRKPDFKPI